MEKTTNILIYLQIIYAALIVVIVTVSVLWGIRTGQFKNDKNASNLPLEIEDSEIKDDN